MTDRYTRLHRSNLLGVALLVCVALLSILTSGCGASALRTHARAALVAAHTHRAAVTALEAARAEALDRVEAAHPTDPEHDLEIDREAARWRPALEALDTLAVTIRAWADAIQLARIAVLGEVGIADLIPIGARALALYSQVAALARSLGADVPALPAWLGAMLGALGGVP